MTGHKSTRSRRLDIPVHHRSSQRAAISTAKRHPARRPSGHGYLKEMAKHLGAVGRYMKDLTAHPAMQLTPETVGDRIAVAAQSARRADQDQIVQSRTELQHATRELRAITTNARTTADQRAIVMRSEERRKGTERVQTRR